MNTQKSDKLMAEIRKLIAKSKKLINRFRRN